MISFLIEILFEPSDGDDCSVGGGGVWSWKTLLSATFEAKKLLLFLNLTASSEENFIHFVQLVAQQHSKLLRTKNHNSGCGQRHIFARIRDHQQWRRNCISEPGRQKKKFFLTVSLWTLSRTCTDTFSHLASDKTWLSLSSNQKMLMSEKSFQKVFHLHARGQGKQEETIAKQI